MCFKIIFYLCLHMKQLATSFSYRKGEGWKTNAISGQKLLFRSPVLSPAQPCEPPGLKGSDGGALQDSATEWPLKWFCGPDTKQSPTFLAIYCYSHLKKENETQFHTLLYVPLTERKGLQIYIAL